MVSCEKSFTVAHFDTLPRIQKKWFVNEVLGMKSSSRQIQVWKFQVQKIYTKNYIPRLPTCVVVRNKGENLSLLPTSTPFLGLSFSWNIMKYWPQDYLYVANMWDKFQSQKMYTNAVIPYLPKYMSSISVNHCL